MKLGSLFDGIGGWLISAKRNGITPVWASEIEKFPIAVTNHHFPEVLHLGSVTDIKGDEIEPVDIITSGSPCQNLSVAGNRKGLEGSESGLFFESVRVVREMQAATGGEYPRYFVWENVPGAFSSNGGRDFLAVLEALTEAGVPMPGSGLWARGGMVRSRRCDVAWRTLDAQHWGVPQRRKRIFLVADFRAVGERRPEVFFEPEGLPGHSPQGRGTGKGAAEAADGCFAIAGNTIDRKPTNGGNGCGFQSDVSYTLTSMDRHAVAQAYSFDAKSSNSMKSSNPYSGCRRVDVAKTLDTATPDPSKNQGGIAIAIRERCGCEGGGKGLLYGDDIAHTLATSKDQFVMSYDMTHADDVVRDNGTGSVQTLQHRMGTGGNQVPLVQTVGSLCADDHKGINNQYVQQGKLVMASGQAGAEITVDKSPTLTCLHEAPIVGGVRRLTPLECERLQGLPDNYTLIPHKSCSDSARYKAIGNGMAQPCADFVLSVVRRMAE